jgi:hypothetical protein
MHLRGALALAAALLIALFPAHALAWQESHQTGDDVQVELDAGGKASFHHKLRWHVVRGPLKSIDLMNIDPSAEIEGDVPITTEDGRSLIGHAARVEERGDTPVRIVVDQPRALMRGTFTFALSFRVDMVRSGAITRDGSMWRMGWSAPVAEDGFDGARTVLMTPAAPEAPKPIVADTGTVDDSVVSVLHRDPAQDSLELVRPHVARGEALSWTVRLDPRGFPRIVDPRLRSPVRAAAPEPDRLRETSVLGALGALGLLYAWLLRTRSRALIVAALAGIAVAGGVGLQLQGEAVFGTVGIAVAVLVASIRPANVKPPPRGPGRWLAIRPDEAFAPAAAHLTPFLSAVAVLMTLAGVAMLLRSHQNAPWLVALDGSVLVPLFLGSRAAGVVPFQARAAARWLGRAFQHLKTAPLRVSPWARVGADSSRFRPRPDRVGDVPSRFRPRPDRVGDVPSRFDELRLLVLPRVAMPGVLGLEVGVGWGSTPVGVSASPEVLARVLEESPAAARLAVELPKLRALPGRRPEERVVRMLPRLPTHAATVALVRALAEALTDRRTSPPSRPFTAQDRRRVFAPVSAAPAAKGADGVDLGAVAAGEAAA